jgi:stage III sporulation protein AG
MKNFWSLLKLKRDENGKPSFLSYVILLGLIGLLIIIISNALQKDQPKNQLQNLSFTTELKQKETGTNTVSEDEKLAVIEELERKYEEELKGMLEKLQGVSEVDIMVNLDATSLKIYEKNTIDSQQTTNETDQNGGERRIEEFSEERQTVLIRNGNVESPLLVQIKKPDVAGVMVVAKGLESIERQKMVIEAVSRVLDVPTHRVTANPK